MLNKNARYKTTEVFRTKTSPRLYRPIAREGGGGKVVVCKTGWLGEGGYYISIVNTGNVKMSMRTLNA